MDTRTVHPPVSVRKLTKSYTGNVVLSNADFDVYPGEIVALVGENGAGKSTLIKIITGGVPADSGTIAFHGKSHGRLNPRLTRQLGIVAVHQELSLCPQLTVAENLFLGTEPRRRLGLIDYKNLYQMADAHCKQYAFDLDVRAVVSELKLADRQIVELLKALVRRPSVLILDEATSSLNHEQSQHVLGVAKKLRQQGVGIVFVSHRLQEIFSVCDRAVVLRDGQVVKTTRIAETSPDELVRAMVGRKISDLYPAKQGQSEPTQPVLQVRDLTSIQGRLAPMSFDLFPGEVVGLGGLRGQGQKEVLQALFGLVDRSGTVFVYGKQITPRKPRASLKHGVVYLPEDRKTDGLILSETVRFNITLPHISRLSGSLGTIRRRQEFELTQTLVRQMEVRGGGVGGPVSTLSGGNQQKVVIGKSIAHRPHIYLMDDPTRGIDVGTRQEIYRLIRTLTEDGAGVLLVSSDTQELVGLSDRVLVMRDRQIVRQLRGDDVTEQNVIRSAFEGADAS